MASSTEDEEAAANVDIIGALSQEPFDPISVLNQLLPDGKSLSHTSKCRKVWVALTKIHPPSPLFLNIEASLDRLESIQAHLREEEAALQRELDILLAELHQDQDPERMQIIQELISVRPLFIPPPH